jgi:two-component system phosphate regulon sensor histidine kinase PhoR
MQFLRPHFPRQLFRRFLLQQLLGVLPVILLAALITRVYLSKKLSTMQSVPEITAAYDQAFLFLTGIMAISTLTISLWTGYRTVLPLGRILIKARKILKRDHQPRRETGAEDEWSHLESTIQRIGRDLENKERSLSREREEIEAIMSAITEAVVAVDTEGNVLFYNSRFAMLFGDLGQKSHRLSDFLRNPDVLESMRETLANGSPHTLETQLRTRGETVAQHFSLSLAPLRTRAKLIYGVVGVFHDVSELKRLDQVRIDFVANVSHELSTPLTSIKGYAETLRLDLKENEQASKAAATIERNADRLIELVRDLLSLSTLESGKELTREEIDLAELTDLVVHHLESINAKKQHTIQLHVDTPVLYADRKRIEQILFNLIENAIKYVPEGGKISVFWEAGENEIRLRVLDNGPGIAPDQQARIFERFYRIDTARTREQGGTGLGLSIVKHIMQRHGGKVRLQSVSPHGTEFICSFPSEKG